MTYNERRDSQEGFDAATRAKYDDYYDDDDGQPDEMQEWESLRDIGWGTDEDYGCFEDNDW